MCVCVCVCGCLVLLLRVYKYIHTLIISSCHLFFRNFVICCVTSTESRPQLLFTAEREAVGETRVGRGEGFVCSCGEGVVR